MAKLTQKGLDDFTLELGVKELWALGVACRVLNRDTNVPNGPELLVKAGMLDNESEVLELKHILLNMAEAVLSGMDEGEGQQSDTQH